MKQNIPKEILFKYHREIQRWIQTESVLVLFNRSKIDEFQKLNGGRLKTINEQRQEIVKRYFQFEGENLKLDDQKQFILLEGKTKEDYDKEMGELMAQETVIEY